MEELDQRFTDYSKQPIQPGIYQGPGKNQYFLIATPIRAPTSQDCCFAEDQFGNNRLLHYETLQTLRSVDPSELQFILDNPDEQLVNPDSRLRLSRWEKRLSFAEPSPKCTTQEDMLFGSGNTGVQTGNSAPGTGNLTYTGASPDYGTFGSPSSQETNTSRPTGCKLTDSCLRTP